MAIEWVFFDIGDVLFDENVQHTILFHSMLLAMRRNGIAVEWDEFRARIQLCVREKPATAIPDAVRSYVPDAAQYEAIYQAGRAEYSEIRKPRPFGMLLDDITPVIKDLKRDFRLGIIANQHPPIIQALDDYGVGSLFDVKIIDEIVGVSKPDPRIFQIALEQADCTPEQAMFVGDRPDNDIAPARAVGMRALRFRRGLLYSLYDPRTEAERAHRVVRETAGLAAAVRELASAPMPPMPPPDPALAPPNTQGGEPQ